MNNNKEIITPVQYLKGVGPKLAKLLFKLGVSTIEDLLFYFPRDYEDRRKIIPISQCRAPQDKVLVRGEIFDIDNQMTKKRFSILKITIKDLSGFIKVVFFNQPYLLGVFKKGINLIVSGKVEHNFYGGGLELIPKDWEVDNGEPLAIVPIYNLTEGVFQKALRKIAKTALDEYIDEITEFLPQQVISKNELVDIKNAIINIHFPGEISAVEQARKRLVFDDFFLFQLGLGLKRKEVKDSRGITFNVGKSLLAEFPLPFELTSAQKRAISEILEDLSSGKPMNRLVYGDVGSGKTVVAAIAAFFALKNGYQTAIMAPTEILAQQHYDKLLNWFKGYSVSLVTSNTQRKTKQKFLDADIVIGTHALIEEGIKFKKLGFVIIDEQHRFGVLQRTALAQKGVVPHILFMTATPIPRSLALVLYGDLDRSIINEMPPGRTTVKTYYISHAKRSNTYEFIRNKVKAGQQVFVVCPLVSESEVLDLKAATDETVHLQNVVFPEFKVGLIHGKMKQADKNRIMQEFRDKQINILVSTTVIEVGIDIPNASIMVIEHSERFGLSQLHQLRGRIGRGEKESFCFLMGEIKSKEARTRIKAMLDLTDGFKIAEVDLNLRGPGDFCGVRQSGLPEFKIADIIKDGELLRAAKDAAFAYLSYDSDLSKSPELRKIMIRRHGKFLGY